MTEYVKKALDRLQHHKSKRPKYAQNRWTFSTYGKILQMAPDTYDRELLDKKSTKIIQSIVGTMIYYAPSVYPKIIRAINEISRFQSWI